MCCFRASQSWQENCLSGLCEYIHIYLTLIEHRPILVPDPMTWYCAPIWGTSHGPLVIFRWPDWIPSLWIPVYHCTSTDLNRCVHPTRIPDYNPIEHRPTLYYHTWPHYTAILDYKPIEHRPTLYYYTQSHYTALPILHYLNTNQLNTGPYYSTTSPHHTTILD